ncbi:DUF3040 domain-containing protein [Sciscionella marina]|uniref:DUF3040 domain-containing protein n=1 Tax=Sciscionella marina TaxID=508770 RepID=UPI000366C17E|nr:DUF3040 domain-containing protein [Sciscionella marina]
MPLSEHEQQQLDQIERALYTEDPKFASNVRGAKLSKPSRSRRLQGGVLAVVGLGLLLGGLVIPLRVAEIPIVSVVGFVVMFVGVVLTITALRAGAQDEAESAKGGTAKGRAKSPLAKRMEDRLRKRFDDR